MTTPPDTPRDDLHVDLPADPSNADLPPITIAGVRRPGGYVTVEGHHLHLILPADWRAAVQEIQALRAEVDAWQEWSNGLAALIPEDGIVGDPDGSQESLITAHLAHLFKQQAAVAAVLRAGYHGASRWEVPLPVPTWVRDLAKALGVDLDRYDSPCPCAPCAGADERRARQP